MSDRAKKKEFVDSLKVRLVRLNKQNVPDGVKLAGVCKMLNDTIRFLVEDDE